MSKKYPLIITISLTSLYSLISFLFFKPFNLVFFISYIFGLISISFLFLSFKYCFLNDKPRNEKLITWPVFRVAYIYFVLQLILSPVFMSFSLVTPFYVALLVCLLLFIVAIIMAYLAKSKIEKAIEQDKKARTTTSFVVLLKAQIMNMHTQTANMEMKNQLDLMLDALNTTSPVNNESLTQLENEIQAQLYKIKDLLLEKNIAEFNVNCEKFILLIHKRNEECAFNKIK